MAKLLYLATIYFIIGLSLAHPRDDFPWYYVFFRPFLTPTSICVNNITEAAYLTKMIALINNFQTNLTYNSVLQFQSANFVSYIQNLNNQALLYSNCSAFVTGVKTAKAADKAAERKRQQIGEDIEQQIRQVIRNVTGSNGPNDMDSNEQF